MEEFPVIHNAKGFEPFMGSSVAAYNSMLNVIFLGTGFRDEHAEVVLGHEILHWLLNRIGEPEASRGLDRRISKRISMIPDDDPSANDPFLASRFVGVNGFD